MKFFKRVGKFISTVFIGGIGIIFPIGVLTIFFNWLYMLVSSLIRPIAIEINELIGVSVRLASVLSISIILITCFFIGLIVRTRTGNFIHNKLERHLFSRIPGYRLLRETAKPFFESEKNILFTKPALIRPYGSDNTLMTAFITDQNDQKQIYTAFVPTSPNPTSGLVFHLSKDQVYFLDTSFEETMRSIVAGGHGSSFLFDKIQT